jgi:hypothetical protein
MCQDTVSIFQLDHELGVGERFDNAPFSADGFLFRHADLLKSTSAGHAVVCSCP